MPIVRADIQKDIVRGVLSKKLSKMRHLVIKEAINPVYLDEIFPGILQRFNPQVVTVGMNTSPVIDCMNSTSTLIHKSHLSLV